MVMRHSPLRLCSSDVKESEAAASKPKGFACVSRGSCSDHAIQRGLLLACILIGGGSRNSQMSIKLTNKRRNVLFWVGVLLL